MLTYTHVSYTVIRMNTIVNPVTRERIVFQEGIGNPMAKALVFEFHLEVGGGVYVPHMHLSQSETLLIRKGRLRCGMPGHEKEIGPGESVTFAPRMGHTLQVVGDEPVQATVEFRPALKAESFLRNYFGLCAEGRCDAKGEPSLLQISLMMPYHGIWRADIPLLAQKILFTVIRPIAYLLGYRSTYAKYAPQNK